MPIIIRRDTEENGEMLLELCPSDWELPIQVYRLEKWLEDFDLPWPEGSYVADIGFTMRPDATGGGATLSVASMRRLAELGIELWFSEHPM
ncbi:hypothetical protein [uncultured Litoreibacter sp.]|uniref:hypothetical protein n=1 Tax=uncultured Litoreibacter sp. TaxID=1392394 RepID=UPI0026072BD2|nr:hypothetical protein [uncultured Litoreibacter sp.]